MKDDHRSFVSVVQNDSIFKVEKEALFNKQEKWWRWPEKLNLWKYGIGWHIQKNTIKNINLLKMSLLVQIGEELWVTLCFRGLHPDLFEKVLNLELAPILKAEKVNKRHSTPPLAPPTQTQISCICFSGD